MTSSRIKIPNKFRPLWERNPTRYTIITGGRGSFKSYTVGLFLVDVTKEPGHTILLTRYTMSSANISVIPEFVKKITLQEDSGYIKPGCFHITKDAVVNTITGSKVLFKGLHTTSGNQTANLKSIEGLTTFVIDEAEELDDEDDFDTIDLSVRQIGKDNRIIIVMNPGSPDHWIYKKFFESRGIPFDFNGRVEDTTYIFSCYLNQPQLLNDSFIAVAEKTKLSSLAKYNHRFLGHPSYADKKTLWKRKHIQYKECPGIVEFVVAVDPAITAKIDSDETGILGIAKGTDGYYYVFDDMSGIYSPATWANKAVSLYEKRKASRVIAEVNQGGDMVEYTIHTISPAVLVNQVWAAVGKYARAEPVFAMYEQNMVFHTKPFTNLEFEMTAWEQGDEESPNRMDALVWGMTYFIAGQSQGIKPQGVVYFSGM
jgi:hypothetical protein